MVMNFVAGGAAINVLSRQIGARVAVTDVGVNADLSAATGVRQPQVRMGTADMAVGPAMSRDEALRGDRRRHRAGRRLRTTGSTSSPPATWASATPRRIARSPC